MNHIYIKQIRHVQKISQKFTCSDRKIFLRCNRILSEISSILTVILFFVQINYIPTILIRYISLVFCILSRTFKTPSFSSLCRKTNELLLFIGTFPITANYFYNKCSTFLITIFYFLSSK